jgi:glycosyltransferase involved in cell wall biosynthesis
MTRQNINGALISCIVPVFNGELYLAEALESILKQSYRPLEIIVVDDGSSDGTAAVVQRYGDRVRYLRQNNSGPATARNLGLSAVQGDFVAFLDADDLWHAEKLERQMARFEARADLDISVAHVQNFWIPELRDEEERFRDHRVAKPLPGFVTETLLTRRSFFEAIGPFNTELRHGDSTEWYLRAAERGAVMELLPDVLAFRRLHQANRSRLLASNSRDEFLKIVKAVIDRRRVKNDGQVDDSKTST